MDVLLHQLSALNHWQIDSIAIVLLLQGAIASVFPEDVILLTLGMLWSQGRVSFLESFLSAQMGILTADAILVFIGGTAGPALLANPPLSWIVKKKAVDKALAKLKKYGKWMIVTTRFTPLIRGPVYLATGLSRFGLLNFMKLDAMTSVFQISLLLLIGRYIGKHSGSLSHLFHF